MTEKAVPAVTPLVRLPSGTTLRVENINFIAKQEINKYAVFFGSMGNAAIIDGADMDVLEEFGIIQRVVPADKPAIAAA